MSLEEANEIAGNGHQESQIVLKSQKKDSLGVIPEEDPKKLNETPKFSLSQTTAISSTPINAKKSKNQDKESKHTTPSPRPKTKYSPKLSVRHRRQKFKDKFHQQRNFKEVTRENSKLKKNARSAQNNEKMENDDWKDLMEEFRNRFHNQDKKLDKNH